MKFDVHFDVNKAKAMLSGLQKQDISIILSD
jgi:hypothetical protein